MAGTLDVSSVHSHLIACKSATLGDTAELYPRSQLRGQEEGNSQGGATNQQHNDKENANPAQKLNTPKQESTRAERQRSVSSRSRTLEKKVLARICWSCAAV